MSSEESPIQSADEELFTRTLSRLSAHGSDSAAPTPEGTPYGSASDIVAPSFLTWRCVSAARNLSQTLNRNGEAMMDLWEGASITAVAKSLKTLMASDSNSTSTDTGEDDTSLNVKKRLAAAAFYSSLLMLPNSPVSGLFDVATFTTFLSILRKAAWTWPSSSNISKEKNVRKAGGKGRSVKASQALLEDAMDVDSEEEEGGRAPDDFECHDCLTVCTQCLLDLSSCFSSQSSGFKMSDLGSEVLSITVDALVDLTGCLSKSQRATQGPSDASYTALLSLLSSSTSSESNALAVICHRLAPTLMGQFSPSLTPCLSSAKSNQGPAADKTRRMSALHFLSSAVNGQEHPASLTALAATSRFILMRSADKADQRSACCSSFSELSSLIISSSADKEEAGNQIGTFLVRLSQSTKTNHRTVAVDASHALLASLPNPYSSLKSLLDQSMTDQDAVKSPLSICCLSVLIKRSNDKVSGVRAKAISHLVDCVDQVKGQAKDLFSLAISTASQLTIRLPKKTKVQGKKVKPSKKVMDNEEEEEEGEEGEEGQRVKPGDQPAAAAAAAAATIPGHSTVDLSFTLDMARLRCKDEKGMVRKAAVQLLESLVLNNKGSMDQIDLESFEAATCDPLVSVRRSSLASIVRLVNAFPSSSHLNDLLVKCCLPLIHDTESTVQEDVIKSATDLLFTPLSSSKNCDKVKPLMASLSSLGPQLAAHSLNKLTGLLLTKRLIDASKVAKGIESLLTSRIKGESWPLGALMVLEQVACHDPQAPSWQFLRSQWQELTLSPSSKSAAREEEEGARLLWVISHSSSLFPPTEANALSQELLKSVLSFHLPPPVAAAHVSALSRLALSSKTKESWSQQVMEAALDLLVSFMETRENPGSIDDMRAGIALFTAGEVVMTLKQSIALGAIRGPLVINKGLLVRVQALTSPASSSPSSWVEAHAWTCLGKFCLTDEALAKKCVPLFVQELSRSPSPVARNNILVCLSDMISHFTSLGDMHLSRLASCVSDPSPLVRVQALALLAHLLLKDFIKWRGELFHSFTLSLVDDSPQVRKLGEYLLGDALTAKAPLLAYNHFVECIFVLNRCKGLANANQNQVAASIDLAMKGKIDLSGSSDISRAKRDHVYKTLLKRMAPEHKFSTQAKIVSEIFGGLADGALVLEESSEVLFDALRLLPSPEIKVNAAKLASGGDEEANEAKAPTSQSNDVAANARGKLVGALVRRHLVEGIVPLMVELRHMMQAAKHPLLGPLMSCMAQLLRDHKAEIEDILAGDRQLAKELAFDMRQAEAASKASHKAMVNHPVPPPPPPPLAAPKTPRGLPSSNAQPISTAGKSAILSSVLKSKAGQDQDQDNEEEDVSMAMAALTPAPVSSRRGSIHRASFGPAVGNEGNDDDEVIVHLPLNEEALAIEPSTLKPWSLNEGKEKGGKERARAKVKAVRELTRASIGSLLGEENEPEPEPEPVKVDKPVRASRKRNVAA